MKTDSPNIQHFSDVFTPREQTPRAPAEDKLSGLDDAKLIEIIDEFARESSNDRRMRILDGKHTIEDLWTISLRRFVGDHHDFAPREGLLEFTLNRDEPAIVSNVADQTLEPVEFDFSPVDTGKRGKLFISTDAAETLAELRQTTAGVQAYAELLSSFTAEQLAGMEPITKSQADILRQMAEPMMTPEGQLIQPPLDHKAVLELNDAYRADVLEKVFRIKWEMSEGPKYLAENELYSNIFGHAILWFQVDTRKWLFEFENVHPMNVLPDPIESHIERFGMLVIREVMPLRKAQLRFPQFAKELEDAAADMQPTLDPDYGPLGSHHRDTQFEREMVKINTAWVRDWPFPLTPEEALQSGEVTQAMTTVTQDDGTAVDEIVPDTYQLPDGSLTAIDDTNWPTRSGILQVKYIADIDRVLMKVECPYKDMPVGWNKNIPWPFTPYGKGEPFRLLGVTDSINEFGEIIKNHFLYNKYPQEYWPQSLLDALQEQNPHSHPGFQIGVPDEKYFEWFKGNSSGFTVQPPPIDPTVLQMFIEMKQEHDRISGNVGVRQGVSPTAQSSGKQVELLQAQASGPVAYKSRFTEQATERTAKILTQFLIDHMPGELWARYCPELTPQAFEHLWEGMADMHYDVRCELVSGRGQIQQREEQKAVEDRGLGAISMETFRKKRRIPDGEGEQRKIVKEMQAMAPVAPVPQEQAQRESAA